MVTVMGPGDRIGGLGRIDESGVENVRQLCSRIAQSLNVRNKVRLGPSLAAASLTAILNTLLALSLNVNR